MEKTEEEIEQEILGYARRCTLKKWKAAYDNAGQRKNVDSMNKREKAAYDAALEKEHMYKTFAEAILNGVVKSFFKGSQEATLMDICRRLLTDGNLSSTDGFVDAVMKTYIVENGNSVPDNVKTFVRKHFSIFEPHVLVTKFMKEECGCKDFYAKNYKDIEQQLGETLAQTMVNVFGKIIYVEADKIPHRSVARFFVEKMRDLGYSGSNLNSRLLISGNDDGKSEVKEEYQFWLLETYEKIAEIFKTPATTVSKNTKFKDYNDYWNALTAFVSELEKRMTDDVKNREKYKIAKIRDSIYKTYAKGDLYDSVCSAIENYSHKRNTKKDEKILDDFYQKIVLTNKALEVKNGEYYPVNYFVYMPFQFYVVGGFRGLLARLSSCGFLANKDKTPVAELKDKLQPNRGYYTVTQLAKASGNMDLDSLLEIKYKIKRSKNGTVVSDFSTDEKLAELKALVLKTVEEYNLPPTEQCYDMIASEFSKGKKQAVCLGGLPHPKDIARDKG